MGKEWKMETVKTVLQMLAVGVIVVIGMRAAEWLIPAPEMRVIICMADDVGTVEACASAAELLKSANTEKNHK